MRSRDQFAEKSHETIKTVFLVRHAQSQNNCDKQHATTAWEQLKRFQLPTSEQFYGALNMLKFDMNTPLTETGCKQVEQGSEWVEKTKFLEENKVDTILASPLQRACSTCHGLFEIQANQLGIPIRTCEQIMEQRAAEYVLYDIRNRTRQFTEWLAHQPENVFVLVSHSIFLRQMLGTPTYFTNGSIWRSTLRMSKCSGQETAKYDWSQPELVFCPEIECNSSVLD
eukprot:256406_1